MGVYSYGYKAGKQLLKKIFKDKTGSGEVIKRVKPNVPATRLEKASRDLKLAKQKTKGSTAKLKQTQFEIDQANKGKGDYNFTFDPLKARVKKKSKLRENKMGGGMMGRRFGMKEGKLAVTPREKQLAAQYGDKKRITRGDVITIAKKKGNKNGKIMS
tara:strand:- start:5 stop:478 length:474 start_codon:yes stop_codon:yes gene_type:complete